MEVFLVVLYIAMVSSPITIPLILLLNQEIPALIKYFKNLKWAEPPQWKIEYFGKSITTRCATFDEVRERNPYIKDIGLIYRLRSTIHIKEETWQWQNWDSEKTWPSQKDAMRAFKKKGPYKDVPYVEFRAVCVFPGRSKDTVRQARIEAENASRLEYRTAYIDHLEAELAKAKVEIEDS